VTFNGNGSDGGSLSAQSASSSTALTSNAFTNSGYTFGGWSTSQNGSLAYADGANYAFTSSTTLWAIWTANAPTSYTVTFDATDGTGSMSPQSASSAAALNANTFTRSGYTFAGWATTRNGSVAYANSASYPFTSSTTLFAVWTTNAEAPVAPTIAIPAGNTTGISPVTLAPSIDAPSGIGSRCLVDPADSVCKQSVTLPGKGTFVLNANGSVTFTAVLGWTGTATVQYRVTSNNGLSAEAPVTVVVVAPKAPTVTGGSGNTITTLPANVTPQVSGLGSICLIDPADNVCKQSVIIPGKGTMVLNANGTVTFTAVAGFIGTVTVQLQITDAYGQSARGPVTFAVGATSQLQTGATTGTAPVVLSPNVKPEAGSACLVDPNSTECKNTVSIPQVGTWNLNPTTGSVTFKAVTGYVGTTVVQYRVKRAGFDPTETPFVVTVAKNRPPVTVTIGGFKPGSPILTSAIKAQIAAFIKAYVGYRTIECTGFTMGPTVLKVDKWLSTTRAINGCDYVLKTLKAKLTPLQLKNKMETVLGSQIRRVTLTLRD
jgi:CshA-type fibril repeat protein